LESFNTALIQLITQRKYRRSKEITMWRRDRILTGSRTSQSISSNFTFFGTDQNAIQYFGIVSVCVKLSDSIELCSIDEFLSTSALKKLPG
jgi:hypothetical protein